MRSQIAYPDLFSKVEAESTGVRLVEIQNVSLDIVDREVALVDDNQDLSKASNCTGCGQPTVCAYYDGDRKVRLCPECLERLLREPGAREVLLAEGAD